MKILLNLLTTAVICGSEAPFEVSGAIPDWVTVANYEISGVSGPELRAQIDKFGPFDLHGLRHDGYTTWNIRWVIAPERSGKSLNDRISIDLKAIVVVPRIKVGVEIPNKLLIEWDAYILKLKEHERKHIKISENCVAEMKNKLQSFKGSDPNAMLNAIVEKYKQIEVDMDVNCDHGRRDGVKFY